ncbi:hypothetical protein OHR86_28420 [Streptomyces sp. NBC_00441]|uniref:hypothetical protein n=1 Tax=Streptomyces sp. NBC_00441 TaxID=2975742 RepID=UPI002E2B4D13|nr:hypothetical protein [Streptomyces sp. NBC_00441]
MTTSPLTAASFLARSIESDQQRFAQEAERLAEQAARIAKNPPAAGRTTASGEIARLIQEATSLLKRAVALETGLEAVALMNSETGEK